eukprot:9542_1
MHNICQQVIQQYLIHIPQIMHQYLLQYQIILSTSQIQLQQIQLKQIQLERQIKKQKESARKRVKRKDQKIEQNGCPYRTATKPKVGPKAQKERARKHNKSINQTFGGHNESYRQFVDDMLFRIDDKDDAMKANADFIEQKYKEIMKENINNSIIDDERNEDSWYSKRMLTVNHLNGEKQRGIQRLRTCGQYEYEMKDDEKNGGKKAVITERATIGDTGIYRSI